MTYGIDNLKKIVVFSAKNESLLGRLFEGGVTKEDLILLPEFITALPDLIGITWSEVIPEAKDLSFAEMEELIAVHNQVFDLPTSEDKIESIIETILSLVEKVTAAIMEVIALFKS